MDTTGQGETSDNQQHYTRLNFAKTEKQQIYIIFLDRRFSTLDTQNGWKLHTQKRRYLVKYPWCTYRTANTPVSGEALCVRMIADSSLSHVILLNLFILEAYRGFDAHYCHRNTRRLTILFPLWSFTGQRQSGAQNQRGGTSHLARTGMMCCTL